MSRLKRVFIKTDLSNKFGTREILVGTDNYTIKFAADKGIKDTAENSFTIVNSNKLSDEYFSGKDTLDIVINTLNLRASITGLDFYLLAQPFLYFDDSKLSNAIAV
jgi:hypothetical protein